MTTACFPPSPNWYCSQIADCDKTRGILAYGARSDLVLLKLILEDTEPAKQPCLNFLKTIWVHHNTKITAVKFCPFQNNNGLLASVGDDCLVSVLDTVAEDVPVIQHTVHKAEVTSVAWSRLNDHALYLVSGDVDGNLVAINVASKKSRVHRPLDKAIACLAGCEHSPNLVAVGYTNGQVVILDFHLEHPVKFNRKLHGNEVQSLCWAPFAGLGPLGPEDVDLDSRLLATGSRDGVIKIWKTDSGEVVKSFTVPSLTGSHAKKPSADKWSRNFIAVHWPENEPGIILSSSCAGSLLRWNLKHKGQGPAWSVVGLEQKDGKQHSSSIFCITGCHGLTITMSIDRQFMFWDVSKRPAWLLNVPTSCGSIYKIGFSTFNSGLLAFGCGDQTIKTWNLTSPSDPFDSAVLWQGFRSHVMSVGWHPTKEGQLAYGTKDGRIGIYDVLSVKRLCDTQQWRGHKRPVNVYVVCWGPSVNKTSLNAELMRVYSCAGGIVSVFDPAQPKTPTVDLDSLLHPNQLVKPGSFRHTDVAWSMNFTVLVIGNDNGTVELYRRSDLALLASTVSFGRQIQSITWHPDYTFDSSEPCKFRHWLAFAPKGGKIFVHNFGSIFDHAAGTTPLSEATLVSQCNVELRAHADEVPSLSWNPHLDGQLLSASYDGTVKIWDVIKGETLACYSGHNSKVFSALWSPLDPDVVFSGGTDSRLHMWRISEQPKEPATEPLSQRRDKNWNKAAPQKKRGTHSSLTQDLDPVPTAEVQGPASPFNIQELIEQRKREILGIASLPSTAGTDSGRCPSGVAPQHSGIAVDSGGKKALQPDLGAPESCVTEKLNLITKGSQFGNTKKSKKRPLVKPLFPQTNQLDNSCGKVANLEDCILLAGRMHPGSVKELNSVGGDEFGCGGRTHLGLYGQRVDAYRLLKTESEKHVAVDNLEFALQLEVWKGNITGALEMAMKNEELSDWLVALSASVSQKRYAEICNSYAKQLVRSGNPRKAVLYLLATNDVHGAIDILKKHSSIMEAVILAKARLGQKDPLVGQLLEERGDQLLANGQAVLAAKCYLGSGDAEKAAAVLAQKPEPICLRVSAFIAGKLGQTEKADLYAMQAMSESLVQCDFATATTLLKEHSHLASCRLVILVHQLVTKLWTANRESVTKEAAIEGNMGNRGLISSVRSVWASECILDENERGETILSEHLRVIDTIWLPKPHNELQVLANVSAAISKAALKFARANTRAALDEILTCFAHVYDKGNIEMLLWFARALHPDYETGGMVPQFLFAEEVDDTDLPAIEALNAYFCLAHLHRLLNEGRTGEVADGEAKGDAKIVTALVTDAKMTEVTQDDDMINFDDAKAEPKYLHETNGIGITLVDDVAIDKHAGEALAHAKDSDSAIVDSEDSISGIIANVLDAVPAIGTEGGSNDSAISEPAKVEKKCSSCPSCQLQATMVATALKSLLVSERGQISTVCDDLAKTRAAFALAVAQQKGVAYITNMRSQPLKLVTALPALPDDSNLDSKDTTRFPSPIAVTDALQLSDISLPEASDDAAALSASNGISVMPNTAKSPKPVTETVRTGSDVCVSEINVSEESSPTSCVAAVSEVLPMPDISDVIAPEDMMAHAAMIQIACESEINVLEESSPTSCPAAVSEVLPMPDISDVIAPEDMMAHAAMIQISCESEINVLEECSPTSCVAAVSEVLPMPDVRDVIAPEDMMAHAAMIQIPCESEINVLEECSPTSCVAAVSEVLPMPDVSDVIAPEDMMALAATTPTPLEEWRQKLHSLEERFAALMEAVEVKHFPDVVTSARLLVDLGILLLSRCTATSPDCSLLLSTLSAAAEFGRQHSISQHDSKWFENQKLEVGLLMINRRGAVDDD